MRARRRHVLPALLLVSLAGVLDLPLAAAELPREFARLDLTDGRQLRNVVVKTYDPATDRLLIVADNKAMTIPRTLIPAPFAEHFKTLPRSGDTVSTTGARRPLATAAQQYQLATPVAVPATPAPVIIRSPLAADPPPATPNQAVATQAGIDLAAHKRAASARATRYYRFEFRAGSDSIAVTALDLELSAPKVVPGWEGRVTTEGKAYLETYDSRGRSFQRRTGTFEVTTEKRSGDDEIVVVSFAPKS